MKKNENDPYQKERNEEYAEYYRLFIRVMPFVACLYVTWSRWDLTWPEKGRDFLIIWGVHLLVETCYSLVKKDSWVFSISIFLVWSWLIYKWWFVDGIGFLNAFVPPLVYLFMITTVLSSYDYYRKIKFKDDA